MVEQYNQMLLMSGARSKNKSIPFTDLIRYITLSFSLSSFSVVTLLIIHLLLCSTAQAEQAPMLMINNDSGVIGQYFVVLKEDNNPLTLTQARQAYEQNKFSSVENEVLSLGIGISPRWLVAEVNNVDTQNMMRRLIIENSWLDKIDIYVLKNDHLLQQAHLGDSYPFDSRDVPHRFFAFDHDYTQGISQLFIRVETPDPMVLPIFLGTIDDSSFRDMFNGYSYGLLYGVVTALLLYNFILYIQLRLLRYLYYVIHLAMFVLMNQSYTGHAFFIFWPENPLWQHWMNPFLITLYSISGIIFTFLFLKTHRLFPRIFSTVLTGSLALLIIQLILFILKWQSISVILAIGLVIFFSIFSFVLTLFSLKYAPNDVRFFLVATTASLIGSIVTAMTVFGVIPYYEISYRAIEIGVSIDVILLSIALAEQFRILQSEKLTAEKLARLDPLTGIFNRRAFYEQSKTVLYNSQRYQKKISGILLDIDNFKKINDQYGHSIGDEVIIITADMIQKIIRKGDVSARWGGEEFTILLPEQGRSEALLLAERLRENIEKLVLSTSQGKLSFTISLGVAEMSENLDSIDDLIKLADHRMYQAKENGRNQVC